MGSGAVVRCERMTSPAHLVSSAAPKTSFLPSYAAVLRARLADGDLLRLPIRGVSMRPTIQSGAHVLLAAVEANAPRMGDIVLYEEGGRLVCHRVMSRRRDEAGWRLVTK